jgi:hypothetical protein
MKPNSERSVDESLRCCSAVSQSPGLLLATRTVRLILAKKPAEAQPMLAFYIFLVPTARLELAQLAPLPPQDSVSTNFTTSALKALL